MKLIKVIFLPKKISPVNLKPKEYFVETDSYSIAEEKAKQQLKLDIKPVLLWYLDSVAMTEVNVIK